MPTELNVCSACKTRNSFHRSNCLKCGGTLPGSNSIDEIRPVAETPSLSDRNKRFGMIISEVVEKRLGRPHPLETDIWSEAAYAALFTVMYEVVIHVKDMAGHTESFMEATCACAARWINDGLSEAAAQWTGVKLTCDITAILRHRLLAYFDEACKLVKERGCELRLGAKMACINLLPAALILSVHGFVTDVPANQSADIVIKILDLCDKTREDIRDTFVPCEPSQ